MVKPACALFAALLLAGPISLGPALADDTKSLGDFDAWHAYTYPEAGGKVCYASAAAERKQGGPKDRKPTYLAVTHRAKSQSEVSVTGTFGFKPDSEAEVQVGGMKFTFFTKGQSAWSKQPGIDNAIIAALAKGREVAVRAAPAQGAPVVDVIPLAGFAKALAAIDAACGVKR